MIKPFKKGEMLSEVLSEARLGPVADAINQLWEAVFNVLPPEPGSTRSVMFQVTAAVADEAGRYTGEVYIPPALASNPGDVTAADLGDALGGTSIGWDFAASSALAAGDIVPGRVIGMDGQGRRVVVLMNSGGQRAYVLRIDSNATGGGMYNATIMGADCTADNSGSLELPEGMTAGDTDCLLINADEDGQSTHWLKTSSYTTAVYVGSKDFSGTVKRLFITNKGLPRVLSPETIGTTTEGTSAAEASTWNRTVTTSGTDYGDGPVEQWKVYRVIMPGGDDRHLYVGMRKEIYDASGRQKSVGAETIVDLGEIEAAPGGCVYEEDQEEPDRRPATGSTPCEDVNLSKCRSTVTVVGSGFSGDQAGFNGTHNLTYVVDGDGPHWEKKPITGVTGDGQADNGRIMLFCGTGGSTFGWKLTAGWQKLDLSGQGSFGDAFHYTNRTCPPVAAFDDDSTLSGALEATA